MKEKTKPVPSQRKLTFIEVARVFGILVVVLGHTAGMAITHLESTSLYPVISPLVRFVVPAFFVISGLVLGLQHRDPEYRVDAKSFWQRRVHTLILPFFAWNVVYMLLLEVAQGQSIFDWQTLFNLTTGYVHLYFVFVLLQFLLLYTLLSRYFSARVLLACVVIAALSSIIFYAISDGLLWTMGPDEHHFEWRFGKLFFGWAVFFFWGLWLGYSPATLEWLKRHQWWLLLAAACAYVPYLMVTRDEFLRYGTFARDYFLLGGLPYQFLASTWFLVFLYSLEARMRASRRMTRLARFGPYAFGVYVAHLAVLVIIVFLWSKFMPAVPAGIELLVIAALTLLFTIAFLRVCFLKPFRFLSVILLGARGGR
jgi:fucose 4-O-acetylase-like acetyltransferase